MKKKRKRHYDKLARACVDEFFFMLCDEGAGGWMGGREVLYHRRRGEYGGGAFSSCFSLSGKEAVRKSKPVLLWLLLCIYGWMDGCHLRYLHYLRYLTYLPNFLLGYLLPTYLQ